MVIRDLNWIPHLLKILYSLKYDSFFALDLLKQSSIYEDTIEDQSLMWYS